LNIIRDHLHQISFSISGLSPFLGDDDNETLSYVTAAEYDFDDEAFEEISQEAKDFIEKLLHKPPR
jgi:myosin-light-chain kinase